MPANYTWKVDNKLKGAYGETNFDTKTIRINKAKHRKPHKRITPNNDGSENLLTTILHEKAHADHPNKKEKSVEKLARAMKQRMTPQQKQRMYAKVS